MTRRVIVGLVLLAAGIIGFVMRRNWLDHVKLRPVNMAVQSTAGHFSTGNFTVDIKYTYVVELHFRQNESDRAANCLLGLESDIEKCNSSVLQVKSDIYSQNQVSKPGVPITPKPYRANDEIICNLATFGGEPRHVYRVEVDVLSGASTLDSMRPTLVVSPYREFYTDWGATYFFVEPLAMACALAGALLAGYSMFAHLRLRRAGGPHDGRLKKLG